MLPDPCRWIDTDDGAFPRWNAGTVAYVKRDGDRYRVTINWRGQARTGRCGSVAQGKRFIERWITAQKELPFAPKRW